LRFARFGHRTCGDLEVDNDQEVLSMTRLRSTTWLGDRRRRRALTAAFVAALVAVGTAAAVTGRATVAPSNNSLPTISGTAATGSTLTANPGTWSGSAPITFQYQWRICDGNGLACHDIAGATQQTYVLKRDDAGNTVTVRVIGSNRDGSSPATSGPSARIAVAATGPTNTALPTIAGTAVTGGTLTASSGSWSGQAPTAYAYQWTICDGNGAACHDIAGATASAYTLKRDDAGNTVRVRVTARSANGGSTAATSGPSAKIAVAGSTPAPNPGCPTPAAGAQSVPIANVAAPARLQIAQFQVVTGQLRPSTRSFSARFQVVDTCGHPVSGALVYPAAVPYNQFSVPSEATTDTAGWVTMTFDRRAGYPATPKQQQLTMFVRARKAGESILGGVSTRRLISFKIAR
jgi:hypothetical protein